MTLKDDGIEGILERTVTKQGTSSKGEVGDEELSAIQESTYIRKG